MADGQLLADFDAIDQIGPQFRSAMRRLAATVTIVTVDDAGVAKGMVATAVSSLSTDPPSLLVCVNQNASMHAALTAASLFCVNILHRSQADIAELFVDKDRRSARFGGGSWEFHGKSLPYLPTSQAALICAARHRVDYATHSICIGEVVAARVRDDVDPLIYVDGQFAATA